MNLVSCPTCGVVIDTKNRPFPDESQMYTDSGEIDTENFDYHEGDYKAFISCPLCGEQVFEE